MRPRALRLDRRLARRLGAASIAGADEVGRGCLAGPVVVAAVRFDSDLHVEGVRDSKKISASRREKLFAEIRARATAWSVLFVSAREVDRRNVLQASLWGMREALSRVGAEAALVDGHLIPKGLEMPAAALVGGDDRSHCIGAASIVAKVCRDRFMRVMDRRYPGYGFATNVGYPTAEHLRALRQRGPCPLHRTSFAPVAQTLSQRRMEF